MRNDVLIPLIAEQPARWQVFDFEAGLNARGTYDLQRDYKIACPASVILVAGLCSASPPLADLIDFSVLLEVPVHERHRRTALRDDAKFTEKWHQIWDDFEAYYFGQVCPPDSFDLRVPNYVDSNPAPVSANSTGKQS